MFCNKNKIAWDDFDSLRECVKSFVKEKRYIHVLGVEKEAGKLAEIFECGANLAKKLKSAAILHDITKEFDRETQLEICEKYKIKLSESDMRTEKEWHAKTGAYIAKCEFGADGIVFDAIYYHTLGKNKDFTLCDKIIYLADYIEPNRAYQDCIDVREFFYSKIDKTGSPDEKQKVLDDTVLFSLNRTIKSLIDENSFIHKNTVKCRNSFLI